MPQRPFLPSDLPADKIFVRAVTAHAVAAARGSYGRPAQLSRTFWPGDSATPALIERAAVAGATTTTTGWAAELVGKAVGSFIGSLLDNSAAARLIAAAPRFDMSGVGQIVLPNAPPIGAPLQWIGEGDPIPAAASVIGGPVLGPARKLALISAFTGELNRVSAGDAENIIGLILRDGMARQLDLSLFSADAADATRPAGILDGISPVPATAGGGLDAALGDVRGLTDAVVTGGGGTPMLFTSPGRALTLMGYAPALSGRVFGSASIDPEVLIAVDPRGFASMFGSEPDLMVTREAAIHFEDTAPLDIASPAAPPTVAAPVREAFQTNVIFIRAILDCAWVMRVPGAVSFISTGMSW